MNRNHTKRVSGASVALIFALLCCQQGARADDGEPQATATQAKSVACDNGRTDCSPGEHLAGLNTARPGHDGLQNKCDPTAQSCDLRGKHQHTQADERARDRHACRD